MDTVHQYRGILITLLKKGGIFSEVSVAGWRSWPGLGLPYRIAGGCRLPPPSMLLSSNEKDGCGRGGGGAGTVVAVVATTNHLK